MLRGRDHCGGNCVMRGCDHSGGDCECVYCNCMVRINCVVFYNYWFT